MDTTLNRRIRRNPAGDWPGVHPTADIDPTARVIGLVKIGRHVSIGPSAVIRADEQDDGGHVCPIIIEDECNVRDGVIIARGSRAGG